MALNIVKEMGEKKNAESKLPYHLLTKEMLDALAEGLRLGVEKGYAPRNWEKGLPIVECSCAAALRHIMKYINGEDLNCEVNPETGKPCTPINHLKCAMTNLAMAITQIERGRTDLDDRPNKR